MAILKDLSWGQYRVIPAPIIEGNGWKERTDNQRTILLWEDFNKEMIIKDLFETVKNPQIVSR